MESLNGIYASTLSLFPGKVQVCGRVSRVRRPITLWSRGPAQFSQDGSLIYDKGRD